MKLRNCLILAFFLSFTCQCFADGVVRDGLGAISTGRGGVGIGFADSGQMILDNPAAISFMPTMRLSQFDFDVLITELDYSDPKNPRTDAATNPFPMGQLSIVGSVPNSDFGWGLGIFPQAGFSAKYSLSGPALFSGPQTYKSVGALIRFLSAASYRVNSRLSVGANFGVAANHMELEGPYFLQGPSPFVGTPTRFDLQATGAAFSWAAGMQYVLTRRTTIGFNYQSETKFDLNGNTVVEVPGLGTSRFDSTLGLVWPQTFGLGMKHELDGRTRFGLDLVWFDWSQAFDSFKVNLQDPANPVFGAVIGNSLTEEFPLQWRDTLSVKLGVERDIGAGRVMRGGYVYHRSPIPEATLTPFIQTTLEHAISVGYGWTVGGKQIDLAYQYSFSEQQEVGTSQFVGGDFNNSSHNTRAHWVSIGVVQRF
jgi:long-subunit fatty acid transport protein